MSEALFPEPVDTGRICCETALLDLEVGDCVEMEGPFEWFVTEWVELSNGYIQVDLKRNSAAPASQRIVGPRFQEVLVLCL